MLVSTAPHRDLDSRLETALGVNQPRYPVLGWLRVFLVNPYSGLFAVLIVDFFEQIQQQLFETAVASNSFQALPDADGEFPEGYHMMTSQEIRVYSSSPRRLLGRGVGMALSFLGARFFGVPSILFFVVSITLMSLFYGTILHEYLTLGYLNTETFIWTSTHYFGVATGFYYGGFMPLLGFERVNYTRDNPDRAFEFRDYLTVSTLGLLVGFGIQTIMIAVGMLRPFLVLSLICVGCELVMTVALLVSFFRSGQQFRLSHLWFLVGSAAVYLLIFFFVTPESLLNLAGIFGTVCSIAIFFLCAMQDQRLRVSGVTEYRPWMLICGCILLTIFFGVSKMMFMRENSVLPAMILSRGYDVPTWGTQESASAVFTNTLITVVPFLFFLFPGMFISLNLVRTFSVFWRFTAYLLGSAFGWAMISVILTYNTEDYVPIPLFMLWQCTFEIVIGFFFAESMNVIFVMIPISLNPGIWLGVIYELQYILPTYINDLYTEHFMPSNIQAAPPGSPERAHDILEYRDAYLQMSIMYLVLGVLVFLVTHAYLEGWLNNLISRFRAAGGRDAYWRSLVERSGLSVEHAEF